MKNFIERYVSNNNIKSYLSLVLDYVGILEEMTETEKAEMEAECNSVLYDKEDYIYSWINTYNAELALKNEDINYLLDLIYGCEFDTEINEAGRIDLIDLQGAYLGSNYDNFEDISSAFGRLTSSYMYDYYGIEL